MTTKAALHAHLAALPDDLSEVLHHARRAERALLAAQQHAARRAIRPLQRHTALAPRVMPTPEGWLLVGGLLLGVGIAIGWSLRGRRGAASAGAIPATVPPDAISGDAVPRTEGRTAQFVRAAMARE
jgi:hypothetical protein